MPKAWEKIVKAIKKDNKKRGVSDKETNPYAIATAMMQKKGMMMPKKDMPMKKKKK